MRAKCADAVEIASGDALRWFETCDTRGECAEFAGKSRMLVLSCPEDMGWREAAFDDSPKRGENVDENTLDEAWWKALFDESD